MLIGIIGLGYVGLPLALAMAEKYKVIGFDINTSRVMQLQQGVDHTHEISQQQIQAEASLQFTHQHAELKHCTVFIITVPTPVDAQYQPDFSYLIHATKTVASLLKKGDIVVYESTVYPGCTEEICMPVLEQESGLAYNQDFFLGYSPERINPGDKTRNIKSILKIVSGSTPAIADKINAIYAAVIQAGTYLAPSIKVAEAAKAIENAQRDVNISFMNELALIFDRLGIDTREVLQAAATKWNFLPFQPGLVGGHCIGVDPHYLAFKAKQVGYDPQVILSGRKVNEQMGFFVGAQLIALLAKKFGGNIAAKKVLILGMAFKENCADTRNTKVVDIFTTLQQAGLEVEVYDPWVDADLVREEYKMSMVNELAASYDGMVLAVAHEIFQTIGFAQYKQSGTLIYDAKGVLAPGLFNGRL